MLKKTDKPNVFKDTKTGALINKDMNRLSAYKKQKKILQEAKESREHVNDMCKTISDLKHDVQSLMSIVNNISEKIDSSK